MKIGDKVRVKHISEKRKAFYEKQGVGWAIEMDDLFGKIGKIIAFEHSLNCFSVEFNFYYWYFFEEDLVVVNDKYDVVCPFCGNELYIPLKTGFVQVIECDVEAHGCDNLFAVVVDKDGEVKKVWKLEEVNNVS